MSSTLQFTGHGGATDAAAYDPRYDPLVDATPGRGRAYAPTRSEERR